MLDQFAHSNPAFGAICLRWVCQGYQEQQIRQDGAAQGLHFLWGILSLVLLAPERIRRELPLTAKGKLSILLNENPEWKVELPHAIKGWAKPFWSSVRMGVATGVLTFAEGRLLSLGSTKEPDSEASVLLRRHAVALGKIFAKEGGDRAIALVFGLVVS
ncbi:three component ABC system middle component [Cystobacter fuscus]|uniref:three component ABC system middle component n=1 Tax=Cystobacter fuscus TaxID=43 RepID=UPI0012FE159B|nr:three component ABC system middle component [Cystobacter fuscus]